MRFEFTVEGVQDLIRRLGMVERGVADLRQLGTWKAVKSEFYRIQIDKFAKEGPGWKALSPKYKAWKEKHYSGKPILQRTGGMYKDFTSDGSPQEEAQEMTFRFKSPAAFHMSKDGRSKMPLRSSLELTDAENERLQAPIVKKMKQLADNAKLRDIRGF